MRARDIYNVHTTKRVEKLEYYERYLFSLKLSLLPNLALSSFN